MKAKKELTAEDVVWVYRGIQDPEKTMDELLGKITLWGSGILFYAIAL